MKVIINRNILNYSAGAHIFCPICGTIADYRSWVMATLGNQTRCACSRCWDDLTKGADLSAWEIIRVDKKAKPKVDKKPAIYKTKIDRKDYRKYPKVNMPKLPLVTNDDGAWSNFESTALYVSEFCRLNHLKA